MSALTKRPRRWTERDSSDRVESFRLDLGYASYVHP